ncbi:unnamed protein product, partial [Amoebophrya sp. A120]|eukprot:GSA120T00009215001.1
MADRARLQSASEGKPRRLVCVCASFQNNLTSFLRPIWPFASRTSSGNADNGQASVLPP